MPTIHRVDTAPAAAGVPRPPQQRRTREQWQRVLDTGVELLEDAGYAGFTIPSLCERAGVPPRALYARVDSKDALFLAVYEHGMERVLADHALFGDPQSWGAMDSHQRVSFAVRTVAAIFRRHHSFLRAIVLISSVHPEVTRRGERYRRELGAAFGSLLEPLHRTSPGRSTDQAREFAFSLVFSALVMGTAYAPFSGAGDDERLVEVVERYLIG